LLFAALILGGYLIVAGLAAAGLKLRSLRAPA
jgi:hypothetical protein